MPSAMSSPSEPVETASISMALLAAQLHDRALAERPFDLSQSCFKRLLLVWDADAASSRMVPAKD
jgi:hypothetical protein